MSELEVFREWIGPDHIGLQVDVRAPLGGIVDGVHDVQDVARELAVRAVGTA